ncbi:MAG: CBS domain-containing protein [Anaeromicrobium sp.]|jgi:CBS domain-containing protein|uniref:CBS domain-containing protein n=1 Tax=Anaeromicrobium sp. TaxID=1929132 RepID=UPI0025F757C7|nr:CBS domain-containing protein [Anaeromicrobium sp.]MCT4594121.1 CBS domain-containing protein [Anaeromicrobium sp.]
MNIQDIMTTNVVTLSKSDTIENAAKLMRQHRIGSIPVCENGKPVGVVTDRDIAIRAVAGGKNSSTKLEEVMSKSVIIGTPEMDVDKASQLMSTNQIRRLPVVDNESIVGIVALGDVAVRSNLQHEAEDALNHISQPCKPDMQ